MKNIVLIGMRGSGKSHIGTVLAEKLHMDFYDSDVEVEKLAGKSIAEIVEASGWNAFRELENGVCDFLATKTAAVISTGGGVVLRKENIAALKKSGIIVLLHVPVQDLAKRISGKEVSVRPSLTGKSTQDELADVWESRKEAYFEAADIVVECPNLSDDKKSDIERHTEDIMRKLETFGVIALHIPF